MSGVPCDQPPSEDGFPDDPVPPGKPVLAGLLLVPTPIGNLGDITLRAIAALRDADVVLCEDTRVTARLFAAHGIATPLSPLHDHNEEGRVASLLERMQSGGRVALVSDAGTPLVSDPGYRLVRAAIAAGLPVSGLPGANAATLALVLSGLPPHPFLFSGFPPPRQAARLGAFATLRAAERAGLRATLLWHEAPHRLAESLSDLATSFGERPAAVARELTKRFEEVRRGTLGELAAHYAAHDARGEITLVVGPAADEATPEASIDDLLHAAVGHGCSVKDAVAQVAGATGLPRRQVYARALELGAALSRPAS